MILKFFLIIINIILLVYLIYYKIKQHQNYRAYKEGTLLVVKNGSKGVEYLRLLSISYLLIALFYIITDPKNIYLISIFVSTPILIWVKDTNIYLTEKGLLIPGHYKFVPWSSVEMFKTNSFYPNKLYIKYNDGVKGISMDINLKKEDLEKAIEIYQAHLE